MFLPWFWIFPCARSQLHILPSDSMKDPCILLMMSPSPSSPKGVGVNFCCLQASRHEGFCSLSLTSPSWLLIRKYLRTYGMTWGWGYCPACPVPSPSEPRPHGQPQ